MFCDLRTGFSKMLLLVILLFFMLPAHGVIHADGGYSQAWSCDLEADLQGVPASFVYHNRDVWEGPGELRCRNAETPTLKTFPIRVLYEGWASATGLAGNARLQLFTYFVQARSPEHFLQSFVTTSLPEISQYIDTPVTAVLQVGQSQPFTMAVQANREDDGLSVPLDWGTLSIEID